MKRTLNVSPNQCSTCTFYRRNKQTQANIVPQYGRCSKHTMVDTMSDGSMREETRRPAIRFATDGCSEFA